MRARVRENNLDDTVRSAGILFSKFAWSFVPEWAESEIGANSLLEIEGAPADVDDPNAQPETVEDKAVKLIIAEPGKSRKARKL